MNKKLLQQIQQDILRHPERFGMSDWAKKTDCGTVCCIGGWALAEKGWKFKKQSDGWVVYISPKGSVKNSDDGFDPQNAAADALRLSIEQASKLFYEENWPIDFYNLFNDASTPLARAAVAVARIDHFIETGN
jgi:hypothetical protein